MKSGKVMKSMKAVKSGKAMKSMKALQYGGTAGTVVDGQCGRRWFYIDPNINEPGIYAFYRQSDVHGNGRIPDDARFLPIVRGIKAMTNDQLSSSAKIMLKDYTVCRFFKGDLQQLGPKQTEQSIHWVTKWFWNNVR